LFIGESGGRNFTVCLAGGKNTDLCILLNDYDTGSESVWAAYWPRESRVSLQEIERLYRRDGPNKYHARENLA